MKQVKPLPWKIVLAGVSYENEPVPDDAIAFLSALLKFTPGARVRAFDALAHPYFDELRLETTKFCILVAFLLFLLIFAICLQFFFWKILGSFLCFSRLLFGVVFECAFCICIDILFRLFL